jgi:predicted nucleic acid-binding protein
LNNLIIVSNTSPITSLAAVGQLDLLKQLYQRIIIPETVYQELTGANPTVPGAKEVSTFPWIETQIVVNQSLVQALRQKLDPGEAAAIALAIALNADRLIIDERKGRKIAIDMGVQVIGILGVLLEAKSNGLIDRVKPIVDDLIAIAGFRISQQLYAGILQAAKESL